MNNIIVLIATTPRVNLLTEFALPSIQSQTHLPTSVVLVSDSRELYQSEIERLRKRLQGIPLHTLTNAFSPGAAGSWNTGISYISKHFPSSYIAIIDDDDTWQPEHLQTCLRHSDANKADVVLSGINVNFDQRTVATNIPNELTVDDFLIGNPGWQGSNTFIKTELAFKVGGFTDGLVSSNDKDFAIRVLESGLATIRYTHLATVNWMCNQSPDALSAPGSKQKLQGCAQFLRLHGNKMSTGTMDLYFQRAFELFTLTKEEILNEQKRLESIND
ncbi:Glycosyltransferase involved in cell wall biogenesis [Methylophaga frappieri]|uniref:Glycosyltransferase involved in cell wall biogenesis n=1 Tax=Methylophaga frappieri (strain ATCC BAA-2434 / DSM 25690 / JAM7) TaxID=754477 RepID=I1YFK1_METFJ|nr:glycosyltransferase [Methylophaga frappieri]AFJ01694.1 Glycosyltransferase involved in cell wall biogenesis [Methylophaga frappieri]